MADLKFIGRILGVIGGILMVVLGIIKILNNVLDQAVYELDQFGIDLGMNFVGDAVGGSNDWLVAAALMIILGIVAIYGYQQLAGRGKGDLFVWGIIYIVVGILGAGLGGLLVLIGGIVLLLDNFI
ncbi:hypothetical protein CEE45_03440 [Candidatus Heimdallarchaeota archaeon B3_Heim]|nr:MAG: hypothetical protein CEE45_03440 [Candidatus Heimdallarchaeota archaeon B3_Heim]